MYTTKGQGAFLSLLPMSLYVIPYFFWVATNSYAYELTLLFFAGVLFLFLVKIEPGTNGELLWWDQLIIDDQGNAYVWSNGLCLVPTLFPFLHNLGIHPFWWIRRPLSDYLERTSNNVAIEHFVDQRRMNYNVEVKTSFLAANFSRIVENTIGWYFDIGRGDPDLLYQRVGFRIILLTLLLGWGANNLYPVDGKAGIPWIQSFFSSVTPSPFAGNQEGNADAVQVSVQLRIPEYQQPIFPARDHFQTNNSDVWKYWYIDGRKYVEYLDGNGKIPGLAVDESLCALVPAGRKIAFLSKYPPRFVVNMVNSVRYSKQPQYLPVPQKLLIAITEWRDPMKKSASTKDSWATLHTMWGAVDTTEVIFAEAQSEGMLGRDALGGLVCF